MRLLVSFLFERIKFQKKDQTPLMGGETGVERIFRTRGMLAVILE